MRFLITGNMGYVGSVLCEYIKKNHLNSYIIGLDTGYFSPFLANRFSGVERHIDQQLYMDTRCCEGLDLTGIDVVVHLAAVSNDPIGVRYEGVTSQINSDATVDLAKRAANAGVKNFVFASSCSVYGAAGDYPKCENDALQPISAYAKSKISAEKGLENLDSHDMVITCLRFATACGPSYRLRIDLVLNDFVCNAITKNSVSVQSNGKPHRPLIDVRDMALAISWASIRDNRDGLFLTLNVGSNSANYTVLEIANQVLEEIPSANLDINHSADDDKRSYKVSFDLYEKLAANYLPRHSLKDSIKGIIRNINDILDPDLNDYTKNLMRLSTLDMYRKLDLVDSNLEWIN